MGDGWETRRRREPGHDWAVLELGAPGRIEEVVVDTAISKAIIRPLLPPGGARREAARPRRSRRLRKAGRCLPEVKLEADKVHVFRDGLADLGAVRLVRLNIVPDGGVSRLRLVGRVSEKGRRMTSLSTHVLDTMHGRPAAGQVALSGPDGEISRARPTPTAAAPIWRRPGSRRGATRSDFPSPTIIAGWASLPDPPFLDEVNVDFGISTDGGHYHVPLLVSPYAYSTYRGS